MKHQALHTGIAAAAIWASAAYSQVLLPLGDFQPSATGKVGGRVEVHVALRNADQLDEFAARLPEFEAARIAEFRGLAVVTVDMPFGRVDELRKDVAVASVTVGASEEQEQRILAALQHDAEAGRRVSAPCEGNGSGALRPLLNAISIERNISIVCSGGEAGAEDAVIHTARGAEGSVTSALEALGDDAFLARHLARHTAMIDADGAWLSASKAAAERQAGNTLNGYVDAANPLRAFQIMGTGPVQLTLSRSYYTTQGQLRLSVVGPAGNPVYGTTGFSSAAQLQLSTNVAGEAYVIVDVALPPGAPQVQFALTSSIGIQASIIPGDWIARILELLKNPNPGPTPKPKECKCEKLTVKRTALAASAKSTDKGKNTAVSVTLTVSGQIQCEKTVRSEKCSAKVTVTPRTMEFTNIAPAVVPVTVDCKGPCDGKLRNYTGKATVSFTAEGGLPRKGTVILTVTPGCAGGEVSGPPHPVVAAIDSNKHNDLDEEQTDSDGDGTPDKREAERGTDPNSWESK